MRSTYRRWNVPRCLTARWCSGVGLAGVRVSGVDSSGHLLHALSTLSSSVSPWRGTILASERWFTTLARDCSWPRRRRQPCLPIQASPRPLTRRRLYGCLRSEPRVPAQRCSQRSRRCFLPRCWQSARMPRNTAYSGSLTRVRGSDGQSGSGPTSSGTCSLSACRPDSDPRPRQPRYSAAASTPARWWPSPPPSSRAVAAHRLGPSPGFSTGCRSAMRDGGSFPSCALSGATACYSVEMATGHCRKVAAGRVPPRNRSSTPTVPSSSVPISKLRSEVIGCSLSEPRATFSTLAGSQRSPTY